MGAEGEEEEKDGKFEAGDVCQNFPPFVRSRALSSGSLPPSPAFPCPYSLERGETSDGREKERGRAETNDATIRHTREKELSALEEAAPKSLLGLETESRVGDATTPPGFAARNSNPELRHFPPPPSRPFCTSSLSEWSGVDFLSSNVTKGGPGSVGFPGQNRMGRENGKYDTTHQDHNGGADEEAVRASVQH